MNFENKKIAVTGVASGIGAATAKKLKSLGATIIGFDINKPSSNVDTYIPIDLTDSESIQTAVSQCPSGLDGLCNIAGVPPTVPPLVQMKVNFYGLRSFTNLILDKINNGSSIVNLASIAGSKYMEHILQLKHVLASESAESIEKYLKDNDLYGDVTYNFSKEAVILWTLKMSPILKEKNISIKAVSPGPVQTPILKDFLDTIAKKQTLPPKGFEGDPNDIAEFVSFMCSPGGKWFNGRNVIIDGGLSAMRMSAGMEL